jgi:DNA invertase Pin-like site-specific DNA recombinase
MSTAIGYIQVTKRELVQGATSLSAQRQQLVDYCRQAGLIFDSRLCQDVGVSGQIPMSRRPGGACLLRRLAWQRRTSGPIRHIVVTRLTRLFGQAQEALIYLRAWDEIGISLHLVQMGHGESLVTNSPKGCLLHVLLEEVLAWQYDRRTDMTWEKKAAQQVYGPTPYGFIRRGHRLVANPDEQAILARIERWQAERWSLHRIADTLNEAGVPSKRGGRWYASTVRALLAAAHPRRAGAQSSGEAGRE